MRLQTMLLASWLLLAAIVGGATTGHAAALPRIERSAVLEPGPCPIGNAEAFGVECAVLRVPERHERPDGPMLELMVALVRSTSAAPEQDPVIYLAGGPGGGALDTLPIWIDSSIREHRDIVLLDQRGSGYSRPALVCPGVSGAVLGFSLAPMTREEMARVYEARATECASELQGQGIDLGAYSTIQNADDVEALRIALGVEGWNLYGISYGTRLALEVMRRHPAGVRSAVLDSVYPPEVVSYEETATNLAAARDALYAACSADPACSTAYGDLRALTARAATLYTDSFARTTIAGETGGRFAVDISERTPTALLLAGLMGGDVSSLPLQLASLAVGSHAFMGYGTLAEEDVAEGMRLSIECAERVAQAKPARIAADRAAHPELDALLAAFPEETACGVWPVPPADEAVRTPVTSDIPSLLISGGLDPATPPRYATAALEHLVNGHQVILPLRGHGGGLLDACAIGIRDRFLAEPAAIPDTACTVDPVPFRTDVAVNRGLPALIRDLLLSDPDGPPRPPTAAMLSLLGLVLASGLGVGLYRLVRRGTDLAWLLAVVDAALLLGFAAGVFLVSRGVLSGAPDALLFGLPSGVAWLLWLPVMATGVTVALLVAVVAVAIRKRGSAISRGHLIGVVIAATGAMWMLITYGVVGLG